MPFGKQWAAALVVVILSIGSSAGQSTNKPILVYKEKYVMGTVFEIASTTTAQSPQFSPGPGAYIARRCIFPAAMLTQRIVWGP